MLIETRELVAKEIDVYIDSRFIGHLEPMANGLWFVTQDKPFRNTSISGIQTKEEAIEQLIALDREDEAKAKRRAAGG